MHPVLPAHLGELHPVETILVVLLAFGPFVALAVVVVLQRRRDASEEPEPADPEQLPDPLPDQLPD